MHRRDIWSAVAARVAPLLVLAWAGCEAPLVDPDPNAFSPETLARDGRAVLERSIAAAGGRRALARIRTRRLRGRIEVKPLGIHGRFTIVQARPNRVYMRIEADGLGTIERGCDGTVFWEHRAGEPVRRFEGADLALHRLSAAFDETTYEDLYETIETLGTETVEGILCYRVLLVPFEGPALISDYAQDSGLQVRTLIEVQHGVFQTPMETLARDYRPVDGVLLAHTLVEKSLGTETWRRLETVESNIPVSNERFAVPVIDP